MERTPILSTSDALYARYRILASCCDLRAVIERIERGILAKMQREGYSDSQLQTALMESRCMAFAESGADAQAYQKAILPKGNENPLNTALPPPIARFNEQYEKPLRQVLDTFRAADARALETMQEEGVSRCALRETYLGESLYGDLVGNAKEQAAYERAIWKAHEEKRQARKESEQEAAGEAYDALIAAQPAGAPVAVREGMALTALLMQAKCAEETAEAVLLAKTAYQGKDKIAYARKAAAQALTAAFRYARLDAAPAVAEAKAGENLYAACCKDYRKRLGKRVLTYADEQRILSVLQKGGIDKKLLTEEVAAHSPLAATFGREKDAAVAALLEGDAEQATDALVDPVTPADIYQRILTDYDEALLQSGVSEGVAADRPRYNRLAAKALLTKYGASEDDVKEILKRYGKLSDEEQSDDALDALLREAREAPSEEPQALAEEIKQKEQTPKQEEPAKIWNGRHKSIAPHEQKHAPATEKDDLRDQVKKLRTYTFTAEKVRTRGTKSAEEMYEDCLEQIEEDVRMPFDSRMDESIIRHMFSIGYEEREIEDALQHASPKRMHQRAYGKSIVKSMLARFPSLGAAVQNTVAKVEYNYLQNKIEGQKPLTAYEQSRVRVRDVPTS
ncbi:hypothetical protein [Mitsuokella sp. oral taxon 131]|uniref:hypothetical protein n=1 Tax=Mitsuokella sp. oral taxon 131 TaxID=1321780 RepID=UPI0003AE2FE2|nr:hypothetical protein [Mitsuokella sp. oral taxon 131]ERL03196.1 hypothetical protein HMPREF1985_02358 [Mitsuokella sp. oral taxon 131 str. W9106]